MATPSVDRNPARNRNAFTCPSCEAFAGQEWADLLFVDGYDAYQQPNLEMLKTRISDRWVEEQEWKTLAIWARTLCLSCGELAIWRDEEIVYPTAISAARPPHPDMPSAAKDFYNEARLVVAVSRRAGAAMARATLERLLKEIDADAPTGLKLDGLIQRASSAVSASLSDILDVIRHVGNKALHEGGEPDNVVVLVLDEDNVAIVELLFDAINDLVDELITKPARAKALADQLPQSVRDGIAQRNRLAAERGEPTRTLTAPPEQAPQPS